MPLRNRNLYLDARTFFVTTTCNKWYHLLEGEKQKQIIYSSLNFLNKKYDAVFAGFALMPNHIHFIIFFVAENHLSDYMRDFKKFTSGEIRRSFEEENNLVMLENLRYDFRGQKFKVWMDRFDDLHLKERETTFTKLKYIHQNPVRKGLVENAEDYKHSSVNFYLTGNEERLQMRNYLDIL